MVCPYSIHYLCNTRIMLLLNLSTLNKNYQTYKRNFVSHCRLSNMAKLQMALVYYTRLGFLSSMISVGETKNPKIVFS